VSIPAVNSDCSITTDQAAEKLLSSRTEAHRSGPRCDQSESPSFVDFRRRRVETAYTGVIVGPRGTMKQAGVITCKPVDKS